MPAVVTVTLPAGAVSATQASSADPSSLPAGAVTGIVIGTIFGVVFFIVFVLYLLKRYSRRKFTRVANTPHDNVGGASDSRYLPGINTQRSKPYTRHSQRPSISSEPLMSPDSWPPLPATSRVLSPVTPPRLDSISLGIRDSKHSSYDLFGEISQAIAFGTMSHPATSAQQALPELSPPDLDDVQPHTSAASPSPPPKSHQSLFLHRMLKSRAQASEGVSLARQSSLDVSQSRYSTLDSSDVHADVERLLAEAERTALCDAENAQREHEETMAKGEVGWEEVDSAESIYSQPSASIDHSAFFLDPTRGNISLSIPRRKSSRKHASSAELPPVAEVSDTQRVLEGQTISRPVSTAAGSSLDAQMSHRAERRMSSVVDLSGGTLPLLTSTSFGKDSTGPSAGSIASTGGWGSKSSGRASRYPSLAPSSIGQSSQSGPRSDASTDWHHPPSGLAGLASSLQIEPLLNPHSPVEEQPGQLEVLRSDPVPVKRARLREGTISSVPEVEKRDVMQCGIVHIDVVL